VERAVSAAFLAGMGLLTCADLAAAVTTSWDPPPLRDRVKWSSVIVRGRVVDARDINPKRVVQYTYDDSSQAPQPRLIEFTAIADRVLKGCVRPGEKIQIWQSRVNVSGAPDIARGDTAVLMLRRAVDHYAVYYQVPVRRGRPGVETEFREWPLELLEARLDSIASTEPGDSIVVGTNQRLNPEFGGVSGQIVIRVDGRLRARQGIMVAMDNGRTSTTDQRGQFHIEGRPGSHRLTFPGTTLKPMKVRIHPGCFQFVRITAPH
jgi:hypothetical protein